MTATFSARARPSGSPPNNWRSVFGGPAWTRELRNGEWFLHLFAPQQPDLNWRNPAVGDEYERILRFWLDRGVDGFRIDVAHGLVKDAALRDNPGVAVTRRVRDRRRGAPLPTTSLRCTTSTGAGAHCLTPTPATGWRPARSGYATPVALARYVRPDELHLAFNFRYLSAPWEAPALRAAIDTELAVLAAGHPGHLGALQP